jgi:hypothetical protein
MFMVMMMMMMTSSLSSSSSCQVYAKVSHVKTIYLSFV